MNPNAPDYTYNAPATQRSVGPLLKLAGVVATIMAITALIIVFRPHNTHTIPVSVHVLPTYASVYLNGKQVSATPRLATGTYSVRATAPGFAEYRGTYSVSSSVQDPVLVITLSPVSATAKEYASQNQDLYTTQEGYGATQAHQQSSLIFKKNPLTKSLPYSNLVYTIGYQSDAADPTGQHITVIVEAPLGYRNAAIQKIWEMGYNPADYTIVFKDYENPFKP